MPKDVPKRARRRRPQRRLPSTPDQAPKKRIYQTNPCESVTVRSHSVSLVMCATAVSAVRRLQATKALRGVWPLLHSRGSDWE